MSIARNPRYANYCRYNGRTPEEQHRADTEGQPGGPMVGFVEWNDAMIRDYAKINPPAFASGVLVDHASYDKWLTDLVDGHCFNRAEDQRINEELKREGFVVPDDQA